MTNMAEPWGLDTIGLAESIANGLVSAREAVESCIDQIQRTDDHLKAWTHINTEAAMRQAAKADQERSIRPGKKPLDGVPIAVKDVLDVAGMPTAAGFRPFAGRVARGDAATVRILREAGAIPIGKVSTAQFAILDPPETLNPWNPTLTPGGSSTGSGVAVAARHVPMALGTQTGGSILRPAAYNGVVGFKPTFDLFPTDGLFPTAPSMDHVGVLARSVRDCALILHLISGMRSTATSTLRTGPPRIGVLSEALEMADAATRDSVASAIRTMAEAGADVQEVDLDHPLRVYSDVYRIHLQSEGLAVHARIMKRHRESYGPLNTALLDSASVLPPWAVVAAQEVRGLLRQSFLMWFQGLGHDAVILPATPTTPPQRASTGSSAFLSPFSLIGTPTVALPLELSGGLPGSIQLVGFPRKDRDLLQVASWVEEVVTGPPPPPVAG